MLNLITAIIMQIISFYNTTDVEICKTLQIFFLLNTL
jgi:hypothetical protein